MLETLKVLNLRNKNLTRGKLPISLAKCSMLGVLDVGNNRIHDVFPCQLKNISTLRVLVLHSNKFHGQIGCPVINGTWKMLQIVDLAFYNFSGNRFEGPLLEALDFRALYFLNLSHNELSGPIPPSLGKAQHLESLDLSQNYLDGTIPVQLSDLNFLSFLNLSYDQLWFPLDNCSITTNPEEADAIPTQRSERCEDNGWIDMKSFYRSMPFGFVVTFWVFRGMLIFIQPWRHVCYQFWDDLLFRLLQCYHVH